MKDGNAYAGIMKVHLLPFHWTCPFCGRDTVVPDSHFVVTIDPIGLDTKYKNLGIERRVIACPNLHCKELALEESLVEWEQRHQMGGLTIKQVLHRWPLIPESKAKVCPAYIPEGIRQDYVEACAILNGSPKAAAAMARRCLQGMIRDFHGVSRRTLKDEIDAIKELIDPVTWRAIDAVRSVGNIGDSSGFHGWFFATSGIGALVRPLSGRSNKRTRNVHL
jgi:hypothetical protein